MNAFPNNPEERFAVFRLAVKMYEDANIENFEEACKKALQLWRVCNKVINPIPEVKPKTNK